MKGLKRSTVSNTVMTKQAEEAKKSCILRLMTLKLIQLFFHSGLQEVFKENI